MTKERVSPENDERDLSKLGGRVGYAFDALGIHVPEMAEAAGVEAASVNALIRRPQLRSALVEPILAQIPEHLVNRDWVRLGDDRGFPRPLKLATPWRVGDAGDGVGRASAPVVSAPLAAKLPVAGSPTSLRPLALKTTFSGGIKFEVGPDLAAKPREFGAAIGAGNSAASLVYAEMPDASMAPYLMPGEAFALNYLETDPEADRLYCLLRAGQLTVRRAQREGEGLAFVSESGTSVSIDMCAATDFQVLGRVIARAGAAL